MKKAKPVKIYKDESRLFYIALTTCFCVVALYMYFLSESVVHVVMRKEVDAGIRDLNSKIGTLEAEYIERQHSVSNDIATRDGYVEPSTKIFIEKAGEKLVLSTQ